MKNPWMRYANPSPRTRGAIASAEVGTSVEIEVTVETVTNAEGETVTGVTGARTIAVGNRILSVPIYRGLTR